MKYTKGFKVPPRSTVEIRRVAAKLREVIDAESITTGKILEMLLEQGQLDVVSDDDQRFPRGVEAVYIPEDKCIRLRDRDYEGCVLGTNPRSLFTFWHEFGHMILGHERSFSRDESENHKVYEDSEWQANTFASEFLMPYSTIVKEDLRLPEEVARRFGVSYTAAAIRLQKLNRI